MPVSSPCHDPHLHGDDSGACTRLLAHACLEEALTMRWRGARLPLYYLQAGVGVSYGTLAEVAHTACLMLNGHRVATPEKCVTRDYCA